MCPVSPSKWIVFLLFINIAATATSRDYCPKKCTCRRASHRDSIDFIKLRCGGGGEQEKLASIDEIDLLSVADEVVHLNLTDNLLSTFDSKVQLLTLEKLDLSRNQFTELRNNQFVEFSNLRRLDVSGNNIKTIQLLAFTKLQHLERLKLNDNQINSIALVTFSTLINLRQLDISNNPLTCDCNLLWLVDWQQTNSVKLVSNPKCNTPTKYKDLPLRKLKIDDIDCEYPPTIITTTSTITSVSSSIYQETDNNNSYKQLLMTPDGDQVVFEGDAFELQCKTAPSALSLIEWFFNCTKLDDIIKHDSTISRKILSDGSAIIKISRLKSTHSGWWNCSNHDTATTAVGIQVIVISNSTQYCPMWLTSDNKGLYTWPRTIVNSIVSIPCESNIDYDLDGPKVFYTCTMNGQWTNLNASACNYLSDTTKIFEQFSKVNSSLIESVKHFRNYTFDFQHFHDIMDIVFAIDTIVNYLNYLSYDQIIGGVLIDVTNTLLDLPKDYFVKANRDYGSCNKLVSATEVLAGITSSSSLLHKSNIALELFRLKANDLMGLKCIWYLTHQSDRLFYCSRIISDRHHTTTTTTASDPTTTKIFNDQITLASITIPDAILQDIDHNNYNLFISMYANNKLFPLVKERDNKDVTSVVVGAKLVIATNPNNNGSNRTKNSKNNFDNLTEPILITLKLNQHEKRSILNTDNNNNNLIFSPVWWNINLNNGTGDWSTDGCKFIEYIIQEDDNYIQFSCHHFGYYGLLQDHINNVNIIVKLKLSHPAVYVGSFILFFTFFLIIMTYLCCFKSIQMPKKAKHSLINQWLAIALLCFVYVFGVYQMENIRLCQIVGMLLHYFTLSSLLWMCVGMNCMYKRLSKKRKNNTNLLLDELTGERIKKPIIGLYFVGWGVSMIVCGISASINIREYSSYQYCFLRSGPPLSALYIPFTILMGFILIVVLLIRCQISYLIDNTVNNGHLSEGTTQATENVDLDHLFVETNQLTNINNANCNLQQQCLNRSNSNLTQKTISLIHNNQSSDDDDDDNSDDNDDDDDDDTEHGPSVQLKAHIIFLFIYLLTWLCCAAATIKPIYSIFNVVRNRYIDEIDIISIFYAILCVILSGFTLFFYCIARNDVRTELFRFGCWLKRKQHFHCCCWYRRRTRNISDTNLAIVTTGTPPVTTFTTNTIIDGLQQQIVSRSSSRTTTTTSSQNQCNNTTKSNKMNNNVNLLVLHRQQYRNNMIGTTTTTTTTNNINTMIVPPNIIENPTTTNAQIFYNPHQSTVARKFFKRQKRRNNLMKRNNLTTLSSRNNYCGSSIVDDGTTTAGCIVLNDKQTNINNGSNDQNIYGTNSKVNNTNLHSNNIILQQQNQENPNIFSDHNNSGINNDVDDAMNNDEIMMMNNVPIVEHFVLNAEQQQQRSNNKNRNNDNDDNKIMTKKKCNNNSSSNLLLMRSVSQQCTLEYQSSENLSSDSILLLDCTTNNTNNTNNVSSDSSTNNNSKTDDQSLLLLLLEQQTNIDDNIINTISNNDDDDDVLPSLSLLSGSTCAVIANTSKDNDLVSAQLNTATNNVAAVNSGHSLSVSDLDVLYQQLGEEPTKFVLSSSSHKYVSNNRFGSSPCLSDSEINSYISGSIKLNKHSVSLNNFTDDNDDDDDIETTV